MRGFSAPRVLSFHMKANMHWKRCIIPFIMNNKTARTIGHIDTKCGYRAHLIHYRLHVCTACFQQGVPVCINASYLSESHATTTRAPYTPARRMLGQVFGARPWALRGPGTAADRRDICWWQKKSSAVYQTADGPSIRYSRAASTPALKYNSGYVYGLFSCTIIEGADP